jgi:hypothetical protein
MLKKIQTYVFIGLLFLLTFLCWKDPSKEKIFCYFVSLVMIQFVMLKFNKKHPEKFGK